MITTSWQRGSSVGVSASDLYQSGSVYVLLGNRSFVPYSINPRRTTVAAKATGDVKYLESLVHISLPTFHTESNFYFTRVYEP